MHQGDQYVKRAAELMPNDVNVQMTAGTIAETYANILARRGGYRSSIDERYQRAYKNFHRAAEIDSSKIENLNRFVSEHSEYGFQPFASSAPAGNTENVTSNGGAQTGDLNAEAAQIQKWLQDGKTSAYNAGVGFEWWDEKAKAEFEALPFSNDIAEVCSHVYRFSHYSDGSVVTYVVLVPRHVRISYGGGEYETFDSLVIANIARKNYDPVDHQIIFEPLDGAWESAYIKEGRTQSIVYLPGDDTPPLDWKWLENGQEEIEQKGGTVNLLGADFFYTFEATNDPNKFILHGYYDYDWPNKESQRGSFEVLPGITLPTKSGNDEE